MLKRLNVLDEDRQRVASALHETVIGRVSRVSLELHTMLRDDLAPETSDRIWAAIDDLDAAVKAIRDALFPTSPSS
jgi:signal transduction histidine kinase